MAPAKPTVLAAAQPKLKAQVSWNSSSSGHQTAENKLGRSIGWRDSRTMKLSHQFKSGHTGGKRISDQVGEGSEDWDEGAKALIPKIVRERARVSVGDMLVGKVSKKDMTVEDRCMAERSMEGEVKEEEQRNRQKKIFDGLVFLINGSTYPLISDHALKRLLAENGAKVSLHLGRKQVTHVILGKSSGNQVKGVGKGLSGTKIEKEIRRIGGFAVKYVGVEWVLDSVKRGKRLPETPFANLKLAAKGQLSVYEMFTKSSTASSENALKIGAVQIE